MLTKKIFFLFFLSATLLHAQISNADILKEIDNVDNIVRYKDPKQAKEILLKTKNQSEQNHYGYGIMKSSYTLTILYYNAGDYKTALKECTIAEKYATELENNEYLSDAFRMKANIYGGSGFLNKKMSELKKALYYAEKIKSQDEMLYRKALIYESYAGTYDRLEENEKQNNYRYKSIAASKAVSKNNPKLFNKANNNIAIQYGSLAYTYSSMKKKDSALHYFNEALKLYKNKNIDVHVNVKTTLFSDLAVFLIEIKDYKKTAKYAKEAEKLEKQTSLPYIRREIFRSLYSSYAEINKPDSSKYYLNLYTALNDSILKVEKKDLYAPVNQIISDKEKEKNSTVKNVIIVSTIISLLLLLCGWLFWRRKNKKLVEDYQKLIERSRSGNQNIGIPGENVSTNDAINTALEKLNNFERSIEFTNNKITLNSLADTLEITPDYLSVIIKKYKQKTFSNYINDLRIHHVVFLLYSDLTSRMYNEDYLAQNNGFASKKEFTTAFKKTTGIPFSYFIKKIQKQ